MRVKCQSDGKLPLDEKSPQKGEFTVPIPHSVATEESSLYVVITK
jgi:hypothetical protein